MSDTFSLAIIIIVLWGISMFSPEFAGHVARDYQAKEVKEYAVQLISDYGGYTAEVQDKVEAKMESHGLDSAVWQVTAPTQRVEHREEFTVEVSGSYRYKVFNLLGTGIGNFSIPITTKGVGIGNAYFR